MPPNPQTACNAIYYVPEGAFDRGLPKVAPHVFAAEQHRALDPRSPTGAIVLDRAAALGTPWPASTPAMLARYLVVRAGEPLSHAFAATGEIFCVLRGQGVTTAGEVRIEWSAGDVFVLPGASRTRHEAQADSLLFCATNEPELAFARTRAPLPQDNGGVAPAWFSGAEIDRRLGLIHQGGGALQTAGKSVLLANARLADVRTMLPTLTAGMNSLEPGGDQRPHRHNAAALTLALEGEAVHSMVDGQRVDWIPFGVVVTPPQAVHSHHNRGARMMKSFVIQDGALYYQLRNPAFSWTDAPQPRAEETT